MRCPRTRALPGYAPGRAFGWLVAAWAAGASYFAVRPPATGEGRFNPIVYALDVLLPTSPLGVERAFSPPQAAGYWLAIGMQLLGWALSIAVLPALTRALSRS